jgi:ferritin
MTDKTLKAVNDQIQAELESAYHYLAMSARLEEMNLRGMAHWMRVQWEEETSHAMKFFAHLIEVGQTPKLKGLGEPKTRFKNAREAFEEVLAHEQQITRRIHDLYELAQAEKDYPLQLLLHWFIQEQVEEESTAQEIVNRLKLIGDSGAGLFVLDRELAGRGRG